MPDDLDPPRAHATPARSELIRWALLGTLLVVAALGLTFARSAQPTVALIQPGADSRTAPVVAGDFPSVDLPPGPGLDGSIFYVVARDPLHPAETAEHLGNPRYRMQRPLLSWGAWLLHPSGGGDGLVLALAAVTVIGLFVGALATGTLSVGLGGPAWVAALFPLLPGSWWCLRTTAADALALGLALAAIALARRQRLLPATVLGVLAVLAKEPAILVLGGWWLGDRTRRGLAVVAVPGLAIAAWMAVLVATVPPDQERMDDLGLPLVGLYEAWRDIWSDGRELTALACVVAAVVLGVAALLRRGVRHPLGWAVAVQLGFLAVMGPNPIGTNYGATRMTAGAIVLGALALLTPQPATTTPPAPAAGPARTDRPVGPTAPAPAPAP